MFCLILSFIRSFIRVIRVPLLLCLSSPELLVPGVGGEGGDGEHDHPQPGVPRAGERPVAGVVGKSASRHSGQKPYPDFIGGTVNGLALHPLSGRDQKVEFIRQQGRVGRK